MRNLYGDEAVYYKLNEKGNMAGIVSTHVDDFDVAGRKKFVEMLTKEISKVLDVSQVRVIISKFKGIDVKKMKGGIEISMEDYAKSLEEIQIREAKADKILTREELKVYRKYVGKLN